MAMLWAGYADAAIGCFNAKYKYGFWRPVTAIPAGEGNHSALTADAAWLPLGTTPAHPEYPAAHALHQRGCGAARRELFRHDPRSRAHRQQSVYGQRSSIHL